LANAIKKGSTYHGLKTSYNNIILESWLGESH